MPRAAPSLRGALARPHARVVLDLGCGDARATARLAAADPDALVLGVDTNLDAAGRVLRRAGRPAEKGGLPNLVLLLAPADELPDDLDGRVDELRIELPWGSLLTGLLDSETRLLTGLTRVLAPGGTVRITLNARSLPGDRTAEAAAEDVRRVLVAGGLDDVRVEVTAIRPETGWGKRLAGGRPLPVVVAAARKPTGPVET